MDGDVPTDDSSVVSVEINGSIYHYSNKPASIERSATAKVFQDVFGEDYTEYQEIGRDDWEQRQFERMIREQLPNIQRHGMRRPDEVGAVANLDMNSIFPEVDESYDAEQQTQEADDGWISSDVDEDENITAGMNEDNDDDDEDDSFQYMDRKLGGEVMKSTHPYTAHTILAHQGYDFLLCRTLIQMFEPINQMDASIRGIMNLDVLHRTILLQGCTLERVIIEKEHPLAQMCLQYKLNDNSDADQKEIDRASGEHRVAKNITDLRGIISDFLMLMLDIQCYDTNGMVLTTVNLLASGVTEDDFVFDDVARSKYHVRILKAEFSWRETTNAQTDAQ